MYGRHRILVVFIVVFRLICGLRISSSMGSRIRSTARFEAGQTPSAPSTSPRLTHFLMTFVGPRIRLVGVGKRTAAHQTALFIDA